MPYYGMDPAQWQQQQGNRMDQAIRDMLGMMFQGQQFKAGQEQWGQEFGEEQRQFNVGQEQWGKEFGASQDQIGIENLQAEEVARQGRDKIANEIARIKNEEESNRLYGENIADLKGPRSRQGVPAIVLAEKYYISQGKSPEEARQLAGALNPDELVRLARKTAKAKAVGEEAGTKRLLTQEEINQQKKLWQIESRIENKFIAPTGGLTPGQVMNERDETIKRIDATFSAIRKDSDKNFTDPKRIEHYKIKDGLFLDMPKKYNVISKLKEEKPGLVTPEDEVYLRRADKMRELVDRNPKWNKWKDVPDVDKDQIKAAGMTEVVVILLRGRGGKYRLGY